MGIYKFKEEDAIRFAQEHGKFKRRGSEIVLQKCPYCQAADKDTFSISLITGQYECKRGSCGAHGNMITLSRDFDFSLGRDTDAYYHNVDYSQKRYREFQDHQFEQKGEEITYLGSRGISEETVKRYEITMSDPERHVMVFPFRDPNGDITYFKYRNLKPQQGQSKEFCEKNCKPILYGMFQCVDQERLIITEGQIDSLSVAECGLNNAVSVPTGKNGFTWIPYCWDWMEGFKKIVVFGDCENGSITLAEEIRKRWGAKTTVVQPEDYQGCKDANELLQKFGKEAVIKAVNNAKAPDFPTIKPMAKIEMVDIMAMEKMSTGMKKLDDVLDGGFRFGQLAILTGKRGDGKSTLASMWGREALAQNVNCFFYSGELPDFYFRNWMDRQITKKTKLEQSDIDQLNFYYGERAFFYDSQDNKDDEITGLLETIEVAIKQKGCRFILIDNLMTALEVDVNADLYRAQSQFVGELAAMAKKYLVFIVLVAHPRKSQNVTNDDISGSSNITDRADLVFNYGRIQPKKGEEPPGEDERRLEVMKNRLTGRLAIDKKGIRLVYDNGSKRIAEDIMDFFKKFDNWENDELYDFVAASDLDVPF